MTARSELRLLPWVGPEGKPCYLSTDDPEGFMSRLADHVESIQLGMAGELLEQAPQVLDGETTTEKGLELLRRSVGRRITGCTSRNYHPVTFWSVAL
ncbi:hypothetical protein ABZ619_05325 [Streptomyces sp. NPDC007851]|uniref:hypothetical protein n=1 Tax=Streptomyces sp. NPDC007851 TaxID=3155008 RepID=UPI003406B800